MLSFVFLFYYLLATDPISNSLLYLLESDNINIVEALYSDEIESIIVLAGGVHKNKGSRNSYQMGNVSQERLKCGIEMFHKLNGKIPLLYSGGSGDPFFPVSIEGELAKNIAVSMGVPEDMFWIEADSRNTYESGVAIKKFLDQRFQATAKHRILLVTSAAHMLRSKMVMEKAGLEIIPSPADRLSKELEISPLSFIPRVGNLSNSTYAFNEIMGIVSYKIIGWI